MLLRPECRSRCPAASLENFATPPQRVSRRTGRSRRYFRTAPAKSPMSSSARSGRANRSRATRSEVDPVQAATCSQPAASATSMPRWMLSMDTSIVRSRPAASEPASQGASGTPDRAVRPAGGSVTRSVSVRPASRM